MKPYFITCVTLAAMFLSCTKSKDESQAIIDFPACKPAPLLTDKIWQADTVILKPPTTYAQLDDAGKSSYNAALAWTRNTKLQFTTDCRASQLGGDWDFGYSRWTLSNNDKDITVRLTSGTTATLHNWLVDSSGFLYEAPYSNFTLIYKFR